MTASSAPGRSRRRCSRIFASSIAATMAIRPGPAASAAHASAASAWRPSRRSRCARSMAIRSVVQGAASGRSAGHDRRDRRPVLATAEVRRAARRPPRGVVRDGVPRGGRRRRRGHGPRDRPVRSRIEAVERLVEPVLAGERAGEAGEVARWRLRPARSDRRSRSARWASSQASDRTSSSLWRTTSASGSRRPAAQELEVAARDLPALDVAVAVHAEQLGLDGPQARIGHPVAEHAPDDRQQVEVAGVDRRGPAGHPVPGRRAAASRSRGRCRSRARRRRDGAPRARSSSARSSPWSGRRSWTCRKRSRPPTSRARRGRRPCPRPSRARSSRCRGRRAARPAAVARAASRAAPGRPAIGRAGDLARGRPALGRRDDLAVDGGRQPRRELVGRGPRRVARVDRRPAAGPRAGAARYRSSRRSRVAPRRRSRLGRVRRPPRSAPRAPPAAAARAPGRRRRARGAARCRPGSPLAAARRDEVGGPGDQLVVAVPQPLRQPDPAGHRLVQVDRRRLRVRRADLGHETRGRAGRPSAAMAATVWIARPAPSSATSSSSRRQRSRDASAVSQ